MCDGCHRRGAISRPAMEQGHPQGCNGLERDMSGRNGFDGQGAEVDVLYVRANERVAKAIAFIGAYLIWGALGVAALGVAFLGL